MTAPTRQPSGRDYRQFGVRIDAELIAWIQSYAASRGITVNAATAEAIEALRQATER